VIEQIKKETGNEKLEFIEVDLMSLKSVQNFVTEYKSKHDKLHILLNNAGLMGSSVHTSADGLDSQFATNHVAHFYLTTQLLPIIKQSGPSRIVNVSSLAHKLRVGPLDFEHINDEKNRGQASNYSKTKAANILFTIELNKRLEAEGVQVSFL
jgi:NAD(P)-dependent dehydrogenase (short-subunit alcohol dehydrogenase family)